MKPIIFALLILATSFANASESEKCATQLAQSGCIPMDLSQLGNINHCAVLKTKNADIYLASTHDPTIRLVRVAVGNFPSADGTERGMINEGKQCEISAMNLTVGAEVYLHPQKIVQKQNKFFVSTESMIMTGEIVKRTLVVDEDFSLSFKLDDGSLMRFSEIYGRDPEFLNTQYPFSPRE